MKSIFRIISLLSIAFAISTGCTSDDAEFKELGDAGSTDGIVDPNSVGYLSFDALSLIIENEDVEFLDDESNDTVMKTRSDSSIDPSNYTVRVYKESDSESILYEDTYANAFQKTDPLSLTAGVYIVEVYSCEESSIAGVGDSPEYGGTGRYTVGDELTTSVGTITCTLSNVMASVSMSVDFLSNFDLETEDEDDMLRVIVECGGYEYDFYPEDDGKYVYFKAPSDKTMSIYLVGLYNIAEEGQTPNYMKIERGDWAQTLTNVLAGQYRSISIKIDYTSTGSMQIGVSVDEWVYEDSIDVDITSSYFLSSFMEEVILDPDNEKTDENSPVLTLDNGLDVESTYIISSSILDADTETYSPAYKATLTPYGTSTIESVKITISSTSPELMSALSGAGFVDGSIMLVDGGSVVLSDELSEFISVRRDEDLRTVVASIKYAGVVGLKSLVGEHTVVVQAIDSEIRSSFTTLLFESLDSGDGPEVVWDGYDFDTRYEIFEEGEGENPVVVLEMTSKEPTGITSLSVTIDSETLSESTLTDIGLSSYLDLINSDEAALEVLAGLGLPTGSDVKGQSSVTVDITELLEALAILGAGESDFILRVGDASGVTTKTVMVVKN